MRRPFIFLILLFILSSNTANARVSTIRCPDINTLHQSATAITDAAFVNDSYMATTAPFAIRTADMGWFAVVYNIQAASINDAIEKGRLSMQSVSTLSNEFAENYAGIYVCSYDSGKVEVINNEQEGRLYVHLFT